MEQRFDWKTFVDWVELDGRIVDSAACRQLLAFLPEFYNDSLFLFAGLFACLLLNDK